MPKKSPPNEESGLSDARAEHAILLGLAVNYDANIRLYERDSGLLTFEVDLTLERLLN